MPELKGQIVDMDAEASTLCAMLQSPEAIIVAQGLLEPRDFYDQKHQIVFEAIIKLADSGKPVDPITLRNYLPAEDMAKIGGLPFIFEISNAVPLAVNIEYHARIVLERSMQRKLAETIADINQEISTPAQDLNQLLDKAQILISQIQRRTTIEEYINACAVIEEIMREIETRIGGQKPKMIKSGFYDLDNLIGGLQGGELIIIAGRTSMGKTALALAIALEVASNQGGRIGIFSLEMSARQLGQRLIAMVAGIDLQLLRWGVPGQMVMEKIDKASDAVSKLPILIDATGGLSILQLSARTRNLSQKEKVDLIIVDYLQLVNACAGKDRSREQEVGAIARSLKNLAKELDIPVIALSQLSRAADNRVNQKPRLSDLRESGSIEQEADMVIFVYRPEQVGIKKTSEGISTEGLAELTVAKNRNGRTGDLKLVFDKATVRFWSSTEK